jgi:hypothetical protein
MRGLLLAISLLVINNLGFLRAQTPVVPVAYQTAGSSYTQNFDGLPASGTYSLSNKGPFNLTTAPINANNLAGWQLFQAGGSNANASFLVGTGSSTGNGVYSLGATASTERALGSLASSTGISTIGLILTNQTGQLLNSFTVSFTAEQWRKGGSGNKNTWICRYKTGIITHIDQTNLLDEPNLNFSSVINTSSATSLNGNLAVNQQIVSYTVDSINWKPGEQLLLRWDDADETGSDDAVAMDNFSFSASLVSSAPSLINSSITNINANSAQLHATVNDNYATTSVAFEYDTSSTFVTPVNIFPSPDTVRAGSGITNTSATITGLQSGVTYYFRSILHNINGTVTGSTQNFTTSINLPTITTLAASAVATSTAILGGDIISPGGAAISEKGIVWSVNSNPTLANNKIIIGNGVGIFSQTITGLPEGTIIYTRAYAINAGGVAYGDSIRFITQTMITALHTTAAGITNAVTASFNFKTIQNIAGLTNANFSLVTNGISGAFITGITGSANTFTITVNTGTGNGTLGLHFINDTGLSIPVNNKPFLSINYYTIDKTGPQIISVIIPGKSMKVGDTIPVTLQVKPDADIYKILSGNINGYNLSGFTKKNDSIYQCLFVIANGGADIAAPADIPVQISLSDQTGNNSLFQSSIQQITDPIDANKPFILGIQNPANRIYRAGDTLNFICRFSENIIISGGIPSISVTIGTSVKTAAYTKGSGSDSLLFRYVILNGALDMDGIRTAGTITLNNATIKDSAGNTATVSFNNTLATKDILVDAVIPLINSVTVPISSIYKTGNILDFVVSYTKKVFVANSQNLPSIAISIGNKFRNAVFVNGSGSNALLFRYSIQTADIDDDGIELSSTLYDSSFCITDSVGNRASVVLNNTGSMAGIQINPPTIRIEKMIIPENGTYKAGDTLDFFILYNEPVFITGTTGTPSIKLTVGTTSKQANYVNGSGSNTLMFEYIIKAGDEDLDGIKISNTITPNNSSISTANGSNALLPLTNENTNGILVDAIAPLITGIQLPANLTYTSGDTLNFMLNFSEQIYLHIVTDTPAIKLTIGSAEKLIKYYKTTGTNNLLFIYIIQQGDLDKNGISIGSSLLLNNSELTDSAGNIALLNFKTTSSLSNIKIDAVAPVFTSLQTDTIYACANSTAVSISNTLTVTDEESGELITLKIQNAPKYGSLSALSYTANSNGRNIIPATISYTPYPGQYGIDTVLIEMTDGINKSQKTIILNILPPIDNNKIGTAQNICIDQTASVLSGTTPVGGTGVYTFAWETSSTIDSARFNKANGINDQVDYLPLLLSNHTWFRRKITSGPCSIISDPIKITVVKNGMWKGNHNNDWHNSRNWCSNLLPDNTTDVLIYPNTLYPPFITDTARCNQLTIAGNASLSITGILELTGTINGADYSIQSENGTIVCNGTAPQNVDGKLFTNNTLQNMIIHNSSGVLLKDAIIIKGILLLKDGSLQTNDHLIVKSTASVGASANGTFVKGKVRLEHFIKTGRRAFRLFGHPFTHSIGLNMLKDSMDITGKNGSLNGFTTTASNQPSSFYHNPLTGNDSTGMDAGWIPFTHTNGIGEDGWKRYSGIRLLVRGRLGQGLDGTPAGDGTNGTYLPQSLTVSLSGDINTGDQELTLTKGKYAAYHLIANPYASNIDLSRITRAANIGKYYWLWNPMQGKQGGYTSFVFRDKNILPKFGSFIAKVNDSSHNKLLFTENCKSIDVALDSIAPVKLDDIFYVELRLESDSIFWDRLLLLAMDSARNFYDRNDAEKFLNSDVNFYSLSREQKMLSIDARPLNNETTIPLGFQANEQRAFRLRVASVNLPASNTLKLHDKYLNKWMSLEKDSTYSFNIYSDTLSTGNARFEITSVKPVADTTFIPGIMMKINPVPAKDKIIVQYKSPEKGNSSIRILNLSGSVLKTVQLGLQKEGQNTIQLGDLLSGIYIVELKCGYYQHSQKIIKE